MTQSSLKWLTKIALASGLVLGVTGYAAAAKTLKLSHNQGKEVPVHKAMQIFADKVKEYTNGDIRVRIYPNAQLGNQRESVELVQRGALDLAKSNAAELEAFEPLYSVFNLPFIFKDRDHYYRVLEGDIGTQLLDAPQDKGFIGIAYYDGGSRSFYANKPIKTPDDLKGLKVRVQPSPSAVRMVELLGGNPTPVSFGELYTALQQGVVDAAENNESALTDARHGEVVKYYSRDEHTTIPDILVMSTQTWNELTPEQQKAIRRAGKESTLAMKDLWQASTEKAVKKAKEDLGMTFIEVDKAPFIAKVQPMYQEAAQANEQVGELIEKIRQQ